MRQQSNGVAMLRPVAPDPEIYAWLWSEEGMEWAAKFFKLVRHAYGSFAEIKDDHECRDICTVSSYSPYTDSILFNDIDTYGISGVPEEWKRR